MLRPGKFKITDKAIELCNIKKGDRVLEIGCGTGDTTERLEKKYGYKVDAIDLSLEMVRLAKERNLEANIRFGDGEFLDDFSSNTFDLVVMECVLSLINMPEESIHEVLCTLKKGGKLFISDLYMKDVDLKKVEAHQAEVLKLSQIPHEYDQCGEQEKELKPCFFRMEKRFILHSLKKALEDIGFVIIHEEDRTKDLEEYIGQSILDGKEIDGNWKDKKNTGYFMLIAEKPL